MHHAVIGDMPAGLSVSHFYEDPIFCVGASGSILCLLYSFLYLGSSLLVNSAFRVIFKPA